MGVSQYGFQGVHFDGVNDYLEKATTMGIPDSRKWTGSFWVRRHESGLSRVYWRTSANMYIQFNGGGDKIVFLGDNTSGTQILQVTAMTTSFNDWKWHHVLYSFDQSDSNKNQIYIDDVQQTLNYSTNIAGVFEMGGSPIAIGANAGGGSKRALDLADYWMDLGTWIDLTDESNRRKFLTANVEPVYLGSDGSVPTGSAPDIFLSGDVDTWHTNKGTGGGFTENGALTAVGWLDVTDGLVGRWMMDESSGGTVYDVTINGNNGTWTDGVNDDLTEEASTGKVNGALDFDGADDVVTVNHNGALDDLDTITIAAWIKPNTQGENNGGRILDKSPVNNDFLLTHNINDGFHFEARRWDGVEGAWNSASNIISYGAWQHVVVTYDYSSTANDPIYYFNGTMVSSAESTAPSGSVASEPGEIFIGNNDSGTRTFDGLIDDVRIYNRVLSEEEVMQIYAATSGNYGSCTSPYGLAAEMIYNTISNVMQYCDQFGWQAMGPVPGAGGGGCANPPGSAGHMIYNTTYSTLQYCDGATWIALGADDSCAVASPAAGTVCRDGSVYAGLSPDGNVKMYTTPADAPTTYCYNNCNNTGQTITGATSFVSGETNTATLIAMDSDNGTGGIQPHQAAQYCADLVAHGYDDWYMPAYDEVNDVLYPNRAAIGGFDTVGALPYDTSTEASADSLQCFYFDGSVCGWGYKHDADKRLRCVRKD